MIAGSTIGNFAQGPMQVAANLRQKEKEKTSLAHNKAHNQTNLETEALYLQIRQYKAVALATALPMCLKMSFTETLGSILRLPVRIQISVRYDWRRVVCDGNIQYVQTKWTTNSKDLIATEVSLPFGSSQWPIYRSPERAIPRFAAF